MHPNLDFDMDEEGQMTHALMLEIRRLQKSWQSLQPKPPLTRGDLSMLHTIARLSAAGRPTIGEIARQTNQSVPGVSRRIAELEKAGFIERYADENDRRIAYIQISKKGQEDGKTAFQALQQSLQYALREMGMDKMEEAIVLIRELGLAFEIAKKKMTSGGEQTGV